MKNKAFYIKIGLILLASFGIAHVVNKEVFIANTPTINPYLDKAIAARIQSIGANTPLISRFFKDYALPARVAEVSDELLKDSPLQKLAPGVYAKESPDISYTLINDGEVEWVVYNLTVKGKPVTLRVPKGEHLPPQEVLEKLY